MRFLSICTAISASLFLPAFCLTAQGSLNQGTATFGLTTIPNSPTATSGGTAQFLASGGADQLYRTWWFYRLDGDTRETPFNSSNGQLTQTWSGQAALLRFNDVDRRGISADLLLQIYSPGTGIGVLSQRMTLTNRNSTPRTIQLFVYADFDACGGYQNMAIQGPDLTRHQITESCLDLIEFVAPGADRFDASNYPGAWARLTDNSPDDLGNDVLPYGPGDYTGAFQWQDRILLPNESITFTVGFAHNLSALCSHTAQMDTYGNAKGSASAIPTIGSGLPFHGTRVDLSLRDGLNGAVPVLFLGAQPTAYQLGPIGTLYNDALLSLVMPNFNAQRTSTLTIAIPRRPVLCGFSCYWQGFNLDPAAPGGISHTQGMRWTIGGL